MCLIILNKVCEKLTIKMANNVLLLFIVNSILNYVHVHANTVTKARNTWTFIISDYKIIGLELLLTTIKICRPETGKCISAITSCIIMCLSRKSGIREGTQGWRVLGMERPCDSIRSPSISSSLSMGLRSLHDGISNTLTQEGIEWSRRTPPFLQSSPNRTQYLWN